MWHIGRVISHWYKRIGCSEPQQRGIDAVSGQGRLPRLRLRGWVGGRSWPWEGGSENVLDRGKSTHSGSKSEQTSTSGERWEILRKVTLAALSLSLLVTAWDAFPGSHVAGCPPSSWFTPRLLTRGLGVFLCREEEDTQGSGDL